MKQTKDSFLRSVGWGLAVKFCSDTRGERDWCIQQPQTGAGKIAGASWPQAGSSYGNAKLKEVPGEGRGAAGDPHANTNEYINERIKKGWGRVSPTPSPAVIAPVLRGVASFG